MTTIISDSKKYIDNAMKEYLSQHKDFAKTNKKGVFIIWGEGGYANILFKTLFSFLFSLFVGIYILGIQHDKIADTPIYLFVIFPVLYILPYVLFSLNTASGVLYGIEREFESQYLDPKQTKDFLSTLSPYSKQEILKAATESEGPICFDFKRSLEMAERDFYLKQKNDILEALKN